MVSTLMQYEEYLQITNSLNKEYNQVVAEYHQIIKIYQEFLSLKYVFLSQEHKAFQNLTQSQIGSITSEQANLAIKAEIANAKLILSTCRCREVLLKLAQFLKIVKDLSLIHI